MKVEYFKSKLNFGDELNSWLWSYFLSDIDSIDKYNYFVPVGSLLCDWFLERVNDKKTAIFTSGAGYGDVNGLLNDNIDIIGVRGKLTAKALGVDESLAIGDGAALISLVPELNVKSNKDDKPIIFIPHHESLEDVDWKSICDAVGIVFVDPMNTSKYVAEQIINSKLVIAEAMHGAIFADSLRVPWVPVVTTHRINTFKWMDWLSMYSLEYSPLYIGSPSYLLEMENKIRISTRSSLFSIDNNLSYYDDSVFKKTKKFSIKRKIPAAVCLAVRTLHKLTPSSKGGRYKKVIELMELAKAQKGFLSVDSIFYQRVNEIHRRLKSLEVKI